MPLVPSLVWFSVGVVGAYNAYTICTGYNKESSGLKFPATKECNCLREEMGGPEAVGKRDDT